MTLSNIRDEEPPKSLPKLGTGDFTLLWAADFWDGPISGMLSYRGEDYWFDMTQENENVEKGQWYRRYAVVKLTREQLERERKVHGDFQRYVGTHFDYVQDKRNLEGLRPKNQSHLFDDEHLEYCRSQRFEEAEVIAWFER